MKVAIYARCSTANNGQDPTMQTRELREYCERREWQIASPSPRVKSSSGHFFLHISP